MLKTKAWMVAAGTWKESLFDFIKLGRALDEEAFNKREEAVNAFIGVVESRHGTNAFGNFKDFSLPEAQQHREARVQSIRRVLSDYR
jgi:hypothetical protein